MTKETLTERFQRLQGQLDKAKQFHEGEQLAQRIEGDLDRIMNSAWLNLADAIYLHEQRTGAREHNCLISRGMNDNCLICGNPVKEM